MGSRSTGIRPALIAIFVIGSALRLWMAELYRPANEDPGVELDYELLGYVGTANAVVSIVGWAFVVFGVHQLVRAASGSSSLALTRNCWGMCLAIDVLLMVVPFLDPGLGWWEWAIWIGRASTLCLVIGGAAAIAHYREPVRDTSSESTLLAGIGLATYATAVVAFQFADAESFGWYWTRPLASIGASLGLHGGMAMLPWVADENSEDAEFEGASLRGAANGQPSAKRDYLVGGLWLGGGVLLTGFSMQGGGIGGRGVFAYGPMIYGLFRIFRGFAR